MTQRPNGTGKVGMALSTDIRRFTSLGLAAVLLLIVAAPLCLVVASPAMGMSMDPAPVSAPDCDRNPDGSMTACPYANQDSTPAATIKVDLESSFIVPVLQPFALAPAGIHHAAVEHCESLPYLHQVPLRL